MGRANKNTTTHTYSRYYRALDGNEKIEKGALNVRRGDRSGIDNLYCQHKKLFSLNEPAFQFGLFRQTGILCSV